MDVIIGRGYDDFEKDRKGAEACLLRSRHPRAGKLDALAACASRSGSGRKHGEAVGGVMLYGGTPTCGKKLVSDT
jgi:hypothetical protein